MNSADTLDKDPIYLSHVCHGKECLIVINSTCMYKNKKGSGDLKFCLTTCQIRLS